MKLCMGCMNQMEDHLTTCPHCGFNETTLRQESYYLDPGTIIGGKYIVGKVMNYGGHTVSYLGMDAEVNRKVIVKEYLPSDFSTRSEGEKEITIYSGDAQIQFENGLTNFLNEANRIQALGAPDGIARVYDCVAENDTGYVISEYVQGRTLKEILASGKRYSVNEAVAFISKILKGLAKVHPMNVIHCDIAPETIMVTDSGEIKLLDFGATRYVTTANSKSLAIILKQGYAPEEQYRSSGKRGPWTDVYALGAVMYRMITGIVPQESVERTLVDELKEPSKLGVSIPANIENALMNALNVYREERTPSAEVFLRELNSPSVKRIKVAKKKNETGKFPLWAKGLVAALLCIAVVGGIFLVNGRNTGNGELSETSVTVNDFAGSAYEEVETWVEDRKKEGTFAKDFVLKKGYMYSDVSSDSVVYQSIPSGDLSQYATDPEYDVNIKDGQYTGELVVYVYSNEKTSCHDIVDSQTNKYLFEQKLSEDKVFYDGIDDGDSNRTFYDIISIELNDGTPLTEDDIKKEKEIEINISDIKQITYYNGTFFCWKESGNELKDFTGEYIDNLNPQPRCRKEAGVSEHTPADAQSLADSNLVNCKYYTFNGNQKKGYIFYQTCTEAHLDMSLDMNKLVGANGKDDYGNEGILLYALKEDGIGEQGGESLEAFKQRLISKYNFGKVVFIDENGNLVDDVSNKEFSGKSVVYTEGENEGEVCEYFTYDEMEDLTYQIKVKDKVTENTSTRSTNSSGGGYWD